MSLKAAGKLLCEEVSLATFRDHLLVPGVGCQGDRDLRTELSRFSDATQSTCIIFSCWCCKEIRSL